MVLSDSGGSVIDRSDSLIRDVEEQCSTWGLVETTGSTVFEYGVVEAKGGKVPVIFTAGKKVILLEAFRRVTNGPYVLCVLWCSKTACHERLGLDVRLTQDSVMSLL